MGAGSGFDLQGDSTVALKEFYIALTSEQIQNGATTPIYCNITPPVNKYIEIISGSCEWLFGDGVLYPGNINIGVYGWEFQFVTSLLSNVEDSFTRLIADTPVSAVTQVVVGSDIAIRVSNDTVGAGTATAKIWFLYREVAY